LDPTAGDAVRNGADDNASGTAGVLELARLLARRPPARSVLFVTFSGEELGLLGSRYFVEHAPVPLTSIVAMLNFDMIGRLRDDKLIVYGVATAAELPILLNEANASAGLRLSAIGDGFGPSDHSSFYAKQIPVLHFFTDLHDDYHRATDDAERLNAAGEARVVALAERVTRAIADRPARLTYTRAAAAARVTTSRDGLETYLGSVPDMSASDTPGLRLTGVRPGSPADKAGLRAGDVVVEFDGKAVKDIYDYTNALYARQPGDTVGIVVLRGSERVTVRATLGRRGG
ncbi:MAG TPA: M28 family peptidase, partial [Gemmatimonadaceae bacterium]|nr:M28 family peptidase [Gemmatimonadaceae bacterium]